MFTPIGLFQGVPCPEEGRCNILNCIFSHPEKIKTKITDTAEAPVEAPATTAEEPVRKRRRIDQAEEKDQTYKKDPDTQKVPTLIKNGSTKAPQSRDNNVHNLKTTSRKVSPPPIKRSSQELKDRELLTSSTEPSSEIKSAKPETKRIVARKEVKKEALNPRHLAKPPASHPIRMSILVRLHETMVNHNKQVSQDKDLSKKPLVLSPDELVAMALDEEEKAAKENPSVYSNVIKLRITKLRKMNQSDWEKDVLGFLNIAPSVTNQPGPDKALDTGLNSREEIAVLSKLITPQDKLREAGYVTEVPAEESVAAAKGGADAAQGWEQCDRCSGRFQVFPGRREDGLLASGGQCTYHYARPIYPPKQKTDHITGHKEPYFPCCNESVGTSTGCTKSKWHVFKVSEVKRLASIMQFEETPRQPTKEIPPPVCFDCEMGYTTLGLELIRLTAITWPQGKPFLDILVRPIGEILDFNTRYSGVKPEHFAKAVPYDSSSNDTQHHKESHGSSSESLRVVDSPSVARELLFQHIQPETPLIGHALENDLNACRIIHPTVVDTIFLYPHPRGLPMRFGLRTLARKFLDRHIQTGGGSEGHDSMEDSKATGDLVRVKVKDTWKGLKGAGWKIEGYQLIDPKGGPANKDSGEAVRVLGHGAGSKRKALQ